MKLTAALMFLALPIFADWPMPGQNPQRTNRDAATTSVTATEVQWWKEFTGFIPSKAHLVTLDGDTGFSRPDLIFVPTSIGMYAIRASDGTQYWYYPTTMPVGNSPVTDGSQLYFGCFDRTIHALNVNTGQLVWQTDAAEAGYDTTPLLANLQGSPLVIAGNRDGYMYAFRVTDGGLAWKYQTAGRISYSAAANTSEDVIYFASNDSYAYALNMHDGGLVWKSAKLPGDGFYSWWPLVTSSYVIFVGTNNFPQGQLVQYDKEAWNPYPTELTYVGGSIDGNGCMDAQDYLNQYTTYPERRTVFTLNKSNGAEPFYTPFVWNGNPDGTRSPFSLGADGRLYGVNHYIAYLFWLKGRVTSWIIGTSTICEILPVVDSQDETGAVSMMGTNYLYYQHKEEQGTYLIQLDDIANPTQLWTAYNPAASLHGAYAVGHDTGWYNRKYGTKSGAQYRATHGNIVPLTTIGDKVVTHTSNSVICVGPPSP